MRAAYDEPEDDPLTSNDESNDQPVGHFGTLTLEVTSESSGNSYDLDAEVDGTTVDRVYFPKGGWVDFYGCELEEDFTGYCDDEEGRSWYFEGESGLTPSAFVDQEDEDDGTTDDLSLGADDDLDEDEDEN